MASTPCPICANECAEELPPTADGLTCKCPRCGRFSITGSAVRTWEANSPSARQIANASGWIRAHPSITIGSNDISGLLAVPAPTVADRADRLLIELARRFPVVGESVDLEYSDPSLLAISWSETKNELYYLLDTYLVKATGYLSSSGVMGIFRGNISPQGYHYLQELQHSRVASTIGFCAMWFDDQIRPVWSDAIEPAIRDAGYDPKRIDSHEHNNRIDDEILAMIRRSKFIVADFTGQRGGVYFEAGFALGLGLEVIWTCRDDELKSIHFDNRQYSFVTWNHSDLPDFKRRLQNRIEATIGLRTRD